MIRHIVTIHFQNDTSDRHIDDVVSSLAALKNMIDAIQTIEVGRDARKGHRTEVGLTVDVENLERLDEYRFDPAHRKVVDEKIKPYLQTITGVDIEI